MNTTVANMLGVKEEILQKRETTITKQYRAQWSRWEGIREIIQNSWDETKTFPTITGDNGKVIISDSGAGMSIAQFTLLGLSEKKGDENRGKYGEGIKIGMVILTRENLKVIVESRDWISTIIFEEFSGQQVATYYYAENRSPIIGTRVTIHNLSLTEFTKIIGGRFLNTMGDDDIITTGTYTGKILKGIYRGKLFSKGIYVSELPDYEFGYELNTIELGTDRNFTSSYALKSNVGQLFKYIKNEHIERVLSTLLEGKTEESKNVYLEINRAIAVQFVKENGRVIISSEQKEAGKVSHLGGEFMLIKSESLVSQLSRYGIKTAESFIKEEEIKIAEKKLITVGELDEKRYTILHKAMRLIEKTKMFTTNLSEMVAQNKIKIMIDGGSCGGYSNNEFITIDSRNLISMAKAIDVLSEEMIHHYMGVSDVTNSYEQYRSKFQQRLISVLLKDNDIVTQV